MYKRDEKGRIVVRADVDCVAGVVCRARPPDDLPYEEDETAEICSQLEALFDYH